MARKVKDTYPKLGEMLVRKRLVEPEEVDEALALQRSEMEQGKNPPRLGQILTRKHVLNKTVIKEILEEQKVHRGEKRVLKVGLREREGVAVLAVEGRLDETREASLIRVLERLMNRGVIRIAIDCTKLVVLNSHGASAFVAYIDESRARGGDLKFFGLNPNCIFTIDRLGLSKFIQIFDGEEDAIVSFDLPIDEYLSRGALGEYVASETSQYFHLSFCVSAQKITDDSRMYFESKWHARNSGKKPCKKCRP